MKEICKEKEREKEKHEKKSESKAKFLIHCLKEGGQVKHVNCKKCFFFYENYFFLFLYFNSEEKKHGLSFFLYFKTNDLQKYMKK